MRRTLVVIAAVLGFAGHAPRATAQPAGTIRIIIPFAAGGPTDTIARVIQNGLQARTGNTVLIENHTGGTGNIGAALVTRAPADGSTLLLTSDSLVLNPLLLKGSTIDARRDLDPVTIVGRAPEVLSTGVASPWLTLQALIAAAKAAPDTITFGSSGTGGNSHLSTLLLSNRAGIRLVHVPYRGLGPALTDAVAGHTKLVMGSTAGILPLVAGGQLRALAQMGDVRSSGLPDVPTMIESGYPDTTAYVWYGMMAPKGMPASLIAWLVGELKAIVAEPAAAKSFGETMRLEVSLAGPQDMRRVIDDMFEIWGPIITDNGLAAKE